MKKNFSKLFLFVIILMTATAYLTFSAFAEESGDYEYKVLENGTVEITNYTGKATTVVIPSEIDGKSVTKIGERAFSNCTNITDLTISEGITEIGTYAFYRCTSLISVSFPSTVKSVETEAFISCSNLTEVKIDDLSAWCGIDFAVNFANPLYYAEKLTVNGNIITELIIPEGVTRIGTSAFYYFENITSVTFPSSLKEVGASAFYGCSGITEVKTNNLTSWCEIDFESSSANPLSYAKALTVNGNIITDLVVPEGVTRIGTYAFSSCSSIISVTIPSSLKEVGAYAFNDCQNITVVKTNNLAAWCGIDFENPTANPLSHANALTVNGNIITDLAIPEGVTRVGTYAFYKCTPITNVTVPSSVKEVGSNAFDGCSGITEVKTNDLTSWCKLDFENSSANPLYYTRAFYVNGTKLTELVVPEEVTRIGSYSFYRCTNIKSIKFNENLAEIGDGAFYYCSGISGNLEIPERVTQIGKYAFCECSNITSVELPSSLKGVGAYAFNYCSRIAEVKTKNLSDWCEINFENSYANPLYYAKALTVNGNIITELEIPQNVGRIGTYSFSYCRNLKSVTIPEAVKEIGAGAFYYCSGISELYIPESVKSIGSYAFYNCTGISSLDIAEGVTKIGNYAFENCTNITSVTLPSSLKEIDKGAFRSCSNITEVKTNDLATWCEISFKDSLANPLYYAKALTVNDTKVTSLEIPDGVTKISAYAFYNCTGIKSVIIPASVTDIGENAFNGCTSISTVKAASVSDWSKIKFANVSSNPVYYSKKLTIGYSTITSLVIPEGITEINDYAFYGCTGITSVTIPSSVVKIGNNVFENCTALTTVNLTEDLAEIGNYAFSGCTKLKNITIPSTVETIGAYAFNNCSALTSINIPSSVKTIGNSAFNGCSALTQVNITDIASWCEINFYNNTSNPLYYAGVIKINSISVLELIIPEGVTNINSYAFYNCAGITKLVIPEGVNTIGQGAFYNCTLLSSVTIPDTVTYIGSNAFYGCSGLTEVNISDIAAWCAIQFDSMNSNPVYYAKSLTLNGNIITNLVIPEGVTSIEDYTFCNCKTITSVTIPTSLRSIGWSAFSSCPITQVKISDLTAWCNISFSNSQATPFNTTSGSLLLNGSKITNLVIPNTLTTIGSYTFYGCKDITSVTIPDSITSIGSDAFTNCYNLSRVNISNLDSWCRISFSNSGSNPLSKAQQLTVNGTTVTSLTIPEGITEIKPYAFYSYRALTSITIPDSVINIGTYAFYNCNQIKNLVIPSSVNKIGNYAFAYLSSLENVTFSEGLTEIGEYAFYYCRALTSLSFPESLTDIKTYAFNECTAITSVRLVHSLNVGNYAFTKVKATFYYPVEDETLSEKSKEGYYYGATVIWHAYSKQAAYIENAGDDTVKYSVYADGLLLINTFGALPDYNTSTNKAPWNSYASVIKRVIINSELDYIGNYTFYGCNKIQDITFMGSMPEFSTTAFYGVTANAYYTVTDTSWYPAQLKNFGGTITWKPTGCYSDEYIAVNTNSYYYTWKLDYDGLLEITFTSYYYPSGLPDYSVGNAPWFNYRRHIKKVVFKVDENVTSFYSAQIGQLSFYDCDALETVVLTENFEKINASAFEGCKSLKNIENADNIDTVCDYAFYRCSSLTRFSVAPDYSDTIGDYAFGYCTSLEEIALSASIESIGEYAFYNCSKLSKIYLCEYNQYLSNFGANTNSFSGVTAQVLYAKGSMKYMYGESNFGGTLTWTEANYGLYSKDIRWTYYPDTKQLYIYGKGLFRRPYSSGSNQPWYGFREDVETIYIADGIDDIESYVFEYMEHTKTIRLPETLKRFDANAFNDCKKLDNLLLPASLEAIGYDTFNRCNVLTDLYYVGTKDDFAKVKNSASLGKYNTTLNKHFLVEKTKEPTCTSTGLALHYQFDTTEIYNTIYDADRRAVSAPATVPALGHDFVDYISNGDADYYKDGTKTAKCIRCDETDTIADIGSRFVPVSIEIDTLPHNRIYCVGDKLSIEGLTFIAEYEDGEKITFTENEVESYNATMTVAGKTNATISYMGKTTEFEIYIHNKKVVTVDKSNYPESSHNYSNSANETKTFTWEGATKLTITFSTLTEVESNYDYIYLYDNNGVQIGMYTGTSLKGKTFTINGNSFKIKLTSDGSVTKYGYSFSSIIADTSELYHPEVVVPETATCTQDGMSESTHCEICNMVIVAPVPMKAKGHSYTEEITKPATHLETGIKTFTCYCGDSYIETIENLVEEHTYETVVVEPTCLENGYTQYTCACGDSYISDEIDALGHDINKHGAKYPTCTEIGFEAYETCNRCEFTTYKEIASLGHTYTEPVIENEVPESCTVDGYYDIVIYCSVCNTELERKAYSISAKGHTEVVVVAVPPDCVNSGLTEGKHCSVCKEVLVAQTVINAKGHTEVTDEAVAPTCTKTGLTEGKHCSVCKEVLVAQTVINAKGHTEVTDKAVAPTCTKTGLTEGKHCSTCGDILVKQTEIKKQEHNYKAFVTEATCISDGYTTYTCSVCNDTYMTDRTIKLGHNMSDFVTSVQPSCEEKGVQISKCSRCNYSETKDIAAKGHNYRDGVCDICGNSKIDNCSCNCHKGGFMGFIWKIINFFQKLFKINPVCQCGIAHY